MAQKPKIFAIPIEAIGTLVTRGKRTGSEEYRILKQVIPTILRIGGGEEGTRTRLQ